MNRSSDTPDRSVLLKELEALSLRLELEEAEMIASMSNAAVEQELSALTLNPGLPQTGLERGPAQLPVSGDEATAKGEVFVGSTRTRMATRFFQFLSKTDFDLICDASCTRLTRTSRTSLGVAVFLAGILAFFSGSYAIYTSFAAHNWAPMVAVPLGVLYSCMIIMFEREIVGAQNRRAVWIRLPLAIIIGFIVAVPLELRLLEDSINKQLVIASQQENKAGLDRMQSKLAELDAGKKELQESINRYRGEVKRWNEAMEAETVGRQLTGRTGKAGQGPAYKEAERNRNASATALARYENELNQYGEFAEEVKNRIDADYERGYILQTQDFLARYEALEQMKSTSAAATIISWGLRGLFILIGLLPILSRLSLPFNEYDAMVESSRRLLIRRVHMIADQRLAELSKTRSVPVHSEHSVADV